MRWLQSDPEVEEDDSCSRVSCSDKMVRYFYESGLSAVAQFDDDAAAFKHISILELVYSTK